MMSAVEGRNKTEYKTTAKMGTKVKIKIVNPDFFDEEEGDDLTRRLTTTIPTTTRSNTITAISKGNTDIIPIFLRSPVATKAGF